jgi:hypothetical protein
MRLNFAELEILDSDGSAITPVTFDQSSAASSAPSNIADGDLR